MECRGCHDAKLDDAFRFDARRASRPNVTVSLTVLPEGRILEVESGIRISDALLAAGMPMGFYCRGRGACGKCLVEIIEGAPEPAEPAEQSRLAGRAPNLRLACRAVVRGPLTVRIPETSRIPVAEALTIGPGRLVAVDAPVFKAAAELPPDASTDVSAAAERYRAAFGARPPALSETAIRSLRAMISSGGRQGAGQATAVFHGADEILDVEQGDTTKDVYGLAVDLGTTTVAAVLVDLVTGRTMATAAAVNGQVRFGADVVSRITAAYQNRAMGEDLRRAAIDTINGLILSLLQSAAVPAASVYEAAIAGNTAMSHLLLGYPVDSLAVAPFESMFTTFPTVAAAETGLNMNPAGRVYLAPIIRSFVGGDIAAGLAAVDIERAPELSLFIDLGTNGEIVVKKGGRFLATSTAAGPAFEGMNLSCGMIAAPGAISRAVWNQGWSLHTLGGIAPRGVCGSGVVDILAGALSSGQLSPSGAVLGAGKTIALTPEIRLLQKDVREIQLAAAAVKTGIRRLLAEADADSTALERIYVAGAFGNTLGIRNAMKIGLIPSCDEEKVQFVGNTSLAGAKIVLISSLERKKCEDLAGRVAHVALGLDEKFQTTFIEALEFGPWK